MKGNAIIFCALAYHLLLVNATSETSSMGASKRVNCYQCKSVENEDCTNLDTNTTNKYYLPCNETIKEPFCRKIVNIIYKPVKVVRVARTCGWEKDQKHKDCRYVYLDNHMETVCQCFTDGCNSAPRASLTLATLATLLLAHLLGS